MLGIGKFQIPSKNSATGSGMNNHLQIFLISFHHILHIEMFYLNSTLNFGIPPVLVFQMEVYYKVDRPLDGIKLKHLYVVPPMQAS